MGIFRTSSPFTISLSTANAFPKSSKYTENSYIHRIHPLCFLAFSESMGSPITASSTSLPGAFPSYSLGSGLYRPGCWYHTIRNRLAGSADSTEYKSTFRTTCVAGLLQRGFEFLVSVGRDSAAPTATAFLDACSAAYKDCFVSDLQTAGYCLRNSVSLHHWAVAEQKYVHEVTPSNAAVDQAGCVLRCYCHWICYASRAGTRFAMTIPGPYNKPQTALRVLDSLGTVQNCLSAWLQAHYGQYSDFVSPVFREAIEGHRHLACCCIRRGFDAH
jgi:hypothetical protein